MSKYISKNQFQNFWNYIKTKLFPNDDVFVNYIVDSGIVQASDNNNWYYKNWSNGVCEAWSHQNYTNQSTTGGAAETDFYWYLMNTTIPIPDSLFISRPPYFYANASAEGHADSSAAGVNWTRTTCKVPMWIWIDPNNGTTSGKNIDVNIYAVGYWR